MADQLPIEVETKLPAEIDDKGYYPGVSHPGDGPHAWSQPFGFGYLTGLLGLDDNPFRELSTGDALRQTAYLAILDLIAQDFARAPPTLNRRLDNGGSKRLGPREHPLAKMFWLRPMKGMTWFDWQHMMMFHLSSINNCYFWPRSADGRTFDELVPLLPSWMEYKVAPRERRGLYLVRPTTIHDELVLSTRDTIVLWQEEVGHVRTRYIGGVHGVSTMALGNRALALLDTLQRFQHRLYNRDGQQRGVYQQSDEAIKANIDPLNQEQYDRLVRSLQQAIAATKADQARPLILEGGLTFKPTSATPQELGHEKAWDAALSEMARLLRVPPHKFWHLTSVKYENQETHDRNYVSETLLTRCEPFEQILNSILLTEEEQLDYYIEFDRTVLFQADPKAHNERIMRRWEKGLITRDAALMALGENPSQDGNGKVYQMPANAYLLSEQNEVVVAPGGGAAAENPDDDSGEGDAPPPKKE